MNKVFQSTFKARRRVFVIALSLILVLASVTVAFAAWPSFQNDNTNNGVATVAPPITLSMAPVQVSLPTNNPNNDVYSGVDTTSVIDNGIAYTLYNGGDTPVTGTSGGARIQATNLSSGNQFWNMELFDSYAGNPVDVHANNVSQLSTPYLYGTTLFAAKTYTIDLLGGVSFVGWVTSGDVTIDPYSGVAKFTGSGKINGTVTLSDKTNLMDIVANLHGSSGSYTITLTKGSDNIIIGSGLISSYDTFNQYKADNFLQAGTYTMTISVDDNTNDVTASNIFLNSYYWALYSLGGVQYNPPTVHRIKTGRGEANTPISYDAQYFYWGIWGGDRCYYQFKTSNAVITAFTPNTPDDFYNAGVVTVNSGTTDYAVFGGDNGLLYVQKTNDFDIPRTPISLVPFGGQIRSTVVAPPNNANVYFTSKGTPSSNRAYLWSVTKSAIASAQQTSVFNTVSQSQTSVSTPVVSDSNILYIGTSQYNSSTFATTGTVQAFYAAATTGIPWMATIYSGDPVQSSPIVWTDEVTENDYIYFTTNSSNGAGYCRRYGGSGTASAWTFPNMSSNKYSLQGMASDNGYAVWGDDGNRLYIAH
jgi:hypothetical protein